MPTYPLHLTTGRVLAQYQSGAQTRRVRDLPDDGPFVEMHPMLAERIGAVDGEPVVVTTRRGELKAPARVVATIRPDTVFVPFHWVGANRLTNDALDPCQPDAGVQGLRRGGARHERRSSSGPGWRPPGWSRSWSRRGTRPT